MSDRNYQVCAACGQLFCRCTGGPTATVVSASGVPSVTIAGTVKVSLPRPGAEKGETT